MQVPRLLFILLIFGFIIRTVGLDSMPPALNSDELLKAYDGACVYRTGKDHHGNPWPLFFQQSGEYSPPLYIYFAGLFSSTFGVNFYTVRVPSAILGTLSILFSFFLLKEVSGKQAGLICAALVSLSPWNIHFSRIGWEVILLIPLQLAALFFFFRWSNRKQFWDLAGSTFCFALTFYAYPTARVFIPMMVLSLCCLYFQDLKQYAKQTIGCLMLFGIMLTPYVWSLIEHYHAMQARWMFLSVFEQENGWILFFRHYVLHLSPMFLFFTGDPNPLQAMAGGVGLAALFPFFIVGLMILFVKRDKVSIFFLLWFFLFSIPSSMTYDRYSLYSMPNSLRSACGMPILEIIGAIGILHLSELLTNHTIRRYVHAGIAVVIVINAGFIGYNYAVKAPVYSAPDFQDGIREVVEYTETNKQKYEKIVVSPNVRLHPIYLAVFSGRPVSPFDGSDFPKYIIPFYHYVPIYRDFRHQEFERYENIAQWYFLAPGRNLIVCKADEITGGTPMKTIDYPDGSPAYRFYSHK